MSRRMKRILAWSVLATLPAGLLVFAYAMEGWYGVAGMLLIWAFAAVFAWAVKWVVYELVR